MLKGVMELSDAVSVTLGPKGRNVVIDKEMAMSPKVTKDGVSVAKEIILEDKDENTGVRIAREAALKTGAVAGDGTTTSIVLTAAILDEASRYISGGKSNPVDLIRGIDIAKNLVYEKLEGIKRKIVGKKGITEVASISANNDESIGQLIAEAMEKIGKDGVILAEESKNIETKVDVAEGLSFAGGFVNAHFVTDTEKMKFEADDAWVLVANRNLTGVRDIISIIQFCATSGGQKPLFIIADDVTGELLPTLIVNHLRKVLKICVVKSPLFGDGRKAVLEDIAIATGATVINDENLATKNIKIEQIGIVGTPMQSNIPSKVNADTILGRAEKIVVDNERFTIIRGKGDKAKIDERKGQIKNQIDEAIAKNDADKAEAFKKRLAKFDGGIAQIKVGGATEIEMREKKDRVDDAIAATKAAVEDGIVVGGGVALVRAATYLGDAIRDGKVSFANVDEKIGFDILCNAILQPLKSIVRNAGKPEEVILDKVRAYGENPESINWGYNAATDVFEDLFESGVIDPVKVTKTALENASSAARTLIMTECIVQETIDEKIKASMLDPANAQY